MLENTLTEIHVTCFAFLHKKLKLFTERLGGLQKIFFTKPIMYQKAQSEAK